jgi:Protein of unknown function (DUF2393)
MGGLIEPSPLYRQPDQSNWRPILLGVALVLVVVGIVALLMRRHPKAAIAPPPYAANLALSDLKMSAAENFVGSTVTYVDGTITNIGSKTVPHATVEVVFKDEMGQLTQREEVPLHVLKTAGPYPDAVDLSVSPLAPGQSKPFRLTFEHVSANWNQQYPELEIIDVTVN